MLQEFECYVQEIDFERKEFIALLLDVTLNELLPFEEATFKFSVFNEDEYSYIKEGMIFRWVINDNTNMFIINKTKFTKEMLENANVTLNSFKLIEFS